MKDSIDNNIEIFEISNKPNESKVFLTKEEDGAKNPSKFTPEAQQETVVKHSNKRGQTVESPTIIEMISQFRNEREPMAIRTSEIGNKNSLQYGRLDNHKDIELFNQKSLLRDHPRTTHRLLSGYFFKKKVT